jgi:hypothetical protein
MPEEGTTKPDAAGQVAAARRGPSPAAAPVTFDLTYWVPARYRVTLTAAEVEAKLRAAGLVEAAGVAGRIARGEIADADAREDQRGVTGDDEQVQFLAATMGRYATLFGVDAPAGEPGDWDTPEDYHVWVGQAQR